MQYLFTVAKGCVCNCIVYTILDSELKAPVSDNNSGNECNFALVSLAFSKAVHGYLNKYRIARFPPVLRELFIINDEEFLSIISKSNDTYFGILWFYYLLWNQ